jgi:hypothetical protein
MKISGGSNSIDMGVTWEILDRLPWNIKDATLETRVSYSANSTIDATITALSSITSAIPTYSLTTSALTGFAIASSIDSLLFTQNRSVEILRFSHDLPLTASSLCEGFYATFSAKDNAIYEKYYGKTSWNGNDIEYEGKSINDASYAIFSIKVFDRYYPDKDAPFNSEKNWAEKYSQSFIEASGLSYAISQDSIKEIEKNTVQLLNDAKVLLLGDADINSEEKIEIHNTAQRKIRDLIKSAQTRLTSVDSITLAGTTSAITSIINTPSDIKGMNDAKVNAKRALDELASKNPSANKDTGKALRETINTIEKSLR